MADKKVKRKPVKDFRSYNPKELPVLLLEKSEELFRYRMQHKSGSLSQTHILKTTRREIARIKTLILEHKANNKKQEKDGK